MKIKTLMVIMLIAGIASATNIIINDLSLSGYHEVCFLKSDYALINCSKNSDNVDIDLSSDTIATTYVLIKSNRVDALSSVDFVSTYIWTGLTFLIVCGLIVVFLIAIIFVVLNKLRYRK